MRHNDSRPAAPACHHTENATPSQRAWFAFHRAMMSHRHLMLASLSEQGIPPGQAMCLRVLAHNDGISQRDLAEQLSVARPTVTVMLQKMERAGLIERRSDDGDQRLTRVYVTAAGRALQERLHDSFAAMTEATLGALPPSELAELERLLTIVADRFEDATDGEPPCCAPDEREDHR